MQSNFLLGAIQMTPKARAKLKRLPYDLLARHAVNDHGTITPRERKRNELSMQTLGPVRSRYKADPTNFKAGWILIDTNDDWTETLIWLEE